MPEIFVVVEYPNGHRHVAPLYPMALDADSARVLARQIAEEGPACGHCKIGDRLTYAAIEATDSASAVQLVVGGHYLTTGSFIL